VRNMPRVEIVSRGKRIPCHYELHGPGACPATIPGKLLPEVQQLEQKKGVETGGSSAEPLGQGGQNLTAHSGQRSEAVLSSTHPLNPQATGTWAPTAGVSDAVARGGAPVAPAVALQNVLVVVGLGARASTAWCAHVVQHLAGLGDSQGRALARVCTFDPRQARCAWRGMHALHGLWNTCALAMAATDHHPAVSYEVQLYRPLQVC
jgi:hypothetical protein